MSDNIMQAQEQIAVTLARARSDEDRELLNRVRDVGGQVVHIFHGLLRMARIHAPNNTAFDGPVRDFENGLSNLIDILGPAYILCAEDQVFLNDVRIRFEFAVDDSSPLISDLMRHNAGGITFNEPLAGPEIRNLVQLIAGTPGGRQPRTTLQLRLAGEGLSSVQLHPPFRFRMSGSEDDALLPDEFRDLYLSAARPVADIFAAMGASRLPNPLPIRRMVNQMIDAGMSQDIATLAREGEQQLPPFSRHTLMVTSLSLIIGREAGLPDSSLADLGVSAMFHDVGFCMREEGFSVPFARHTQAGLKILLLQRGFHRAKVRRLLAVLQHHRALDDPRGVPALYSRIVHIADDYDILTRYRPGKGPAVSAPDAMARMVAMAGKLYDPLLLQLFVNALGPLPPGSIATLEDGRVVVVISAVRSPETFDKPLARVVRLPDGSTPAEELLIDLVHAPRVVKVHRPAG